MPSPTHPHPHRHPPPIIDSHIHLYPSSALPTLAWCPPSHPLHAQHSIDQYLASTPIPNPSLHGFIFIEADRHSSLHSAPPSTPAAEDRHPGWEHPLQELSFATHLLRDTSPNSHPPRLLGIIPWARQGWRRTWRGRGRAWGRRRWGL